MVGGILAWDGRTLPDFPRVRVLPLDREPAEILRAAMALERGAENFYRQVMARHQEGAFLPFIDMLARAEEGHARLIHGFYLRFRPEESDFEKLYQSLPGEIVEGGQSLERLCALLDRESDDPCLDIVEMAIAIEYAAYDLYRSLAEQLGRNSELHAPLLAIAQAEKEHMRIAGEALRFC